MSFGLRNWNRALAIALAATPIAAWADDGAAEPRRVAIELPAGPLENSLEALGRQTRTRLIYETTAMGGRRAAGVSAATVEEALAKLLKGTGLVYLPAGPGSIRIDDIVRVQASGTTALDEIEVEGRGREGDDAQAGPGVAATTTGPGSPTAKTNGFVANRALSATKTNTPLVETPQSISVVTADQIDAQGVQSLGGAFRYSAGVAGEVNGGQDTRYGGLQIRGFDVTGNSFYKDGLRLPGTGGERATFLTIEPYGAERIEILKGPASILYGQNNPGGVVNYVSKRPTDYAFGEVSASAGQFDRYQGELDVGGPIEGTTLSYRLTAVARDGGNQVDTVRDDRVFLAPAITWKPTDRTTLTALAHYQKDKAGWGLQFLPAVGTVFSNGGRKIGTDAFLGVRNFDRYDTEQASVGYLFEHEFNDNVVVRQNLRYAHLDNQQEIAYGGGYVDIDGDFAGDPESGRLNRFVGASRSKLDTFAVDNQAQFQFDTGPVRHTMLIGFDYRASDYSDTSIAYTTTGDLTIDPFDPDNRDPGLVRGASTTERADQKQAGLYFQDQLKLGGWTLVLGGRQDWADTKLIDNGERDSASAFTGKAGLIYNFANGLAPYVSYSESFLPTLNLGPQGLFAPETGQQYEAGVKYQPPGWNAFITGAIFDLARQNVVRFTGPGFTAEQAGEIRSKGFEIEAVASLVEGLNLRGGYAYIDAEVTKDGTPDPANPGAPSAKGKRPTTVPKHRFSLWADYRLQAGPLAGVGFGGGVRVVSSTFGDDQNTFRVPRATVFDGVVSYKKDSYEFAVNGSNIFDKKYVASCFNADFGCFWAERRRVVAKATYRW